MQFGMHAVVLPVLYLRQYQEASWACEVEAAQAAFKFCSMIYLKNTHFSSQNSVHRI